MYWDSADPVAGCGQFQQHAAEVCTKIAADVSGQADAISSRMAGLYKDNGAYFGASRSVCTEMGCCEPSSDCKTEDSGEEQILYEKCPKGEKVKGQTVVTPQSGSGAPCPPNDPEPYDCKEGPCTLDLVKCTLDCDLTGMFETYCPGVNVRRAGSANSYGDRCKADKQKSKEEGWSAKLGAAAKLLVPAMQSPGLGSLQVVVAGHASCGGCRELNEALSEARAERLAAVLKEEMTKAGAPGALLGRVKAQGYSFACPKESNASSGGRSKNQRAEIYLVGGPNGCAAPSMASPGEPHCVNPTENAGPLVKDPGYKGCTNPNGESGFPCDCATECFKS